MNYTMPALFQPYTQSVIQPIPLPVKHKSLLWPFMGALITGVVINSWFDQIPVVGTKIPAYGYYATVTFTEPNTTTYSSYLGLGLMKGLIFLGLFWVFIKFS